MYRVGFGYDVHRLVEGRPLILGGVTISHHLGLDGHSDADVLTHAIMDALLGATALGDIGVHFPPGRPEYENISSLVLLKEVRDRLGEHGWQVNNVDATIIAESPRLRDFIEGMCQQLSQTLGIDTSRVSVKASTSAGLGFVGQGEGMAALAIAMIEDISSQAG